MDSSPKFKKRPRGTQSLAEIDSSDDLQAKSVMEGLGPQFLLAVCYFPPLRPLGFVLVRCARAIRVVISKHWYKNLCRKPESGHAPTVGTQTRTALRVSGLALLSLSFQTLGIIYSDIGTSPLYVLNGIWPASGPVPSKEDVIGGLSAIVWSLTLIPLVKYVFITLRFGTQEGEGGSFALFQGLFPPEHKDFDSDRTLTGDSSMKKTSTTRAKLPESWRWPLLLWALFGTSLTLADGIFTPAVSVTSAVSGIAVAKPEVSKDVIPISIAFLVVLFLAQTRGTTTLAMIFAPVTFIWLLLLACTGLVNIVSYPGIFRAFDPSRAVLLFVRTRDYDILAGVLLAVTGCEALFANLGQFNMLSIQLSFGCFVYPSLVLAYLGQGARLIVDGENVLSNLFYTTIPGSHNGPLFWILYVFAILATLIASQAMITATFSLIQQLINMRNFPPLRLYYTSDTIQGQVYIGSANWILMIATIIVVAAFKSPTALTNAYGFAVSTVMFTTTVLLAIQMVYVKHLPIVIAIAFFLIFGFFDGLFWGAALKKVPEGAWVPLMIGIILLIIMSFWSWGKGLEDEFDGNNRRNLRHIILRKDGDDSTFQVRSSSPVNAAETGISEKDSDHDTKKDPSYYVLERGDITSEDISATNKGDLKALSRIPTCAVFHKMTFGQGVPHTFVSFLRQWPALPRVVIFLSARVLPTARIPADERYIVSKVRTIQGFYGVTYHLGFRDDFDVKVEEIIEQICALEKRADPVDSAELIQEIKEVAQSSTHIVPHYIMSSKDLRGGRFMAVVNYCRRFLIEEIYRRAATMFPETENWHGSPDKIVHVGISATI
ncbi:Potassium transporter [Abortiporus biennis]